MLHDLEAGNQVEFSVAKGQSIDRRLHAFDRDVFQRRAAPVRPNEARPPSTASLKTAKEQTVAAPDVEQAADVGGNLGAEGGDPRFVLGTKRAFFPEFFLLIGQLFERATGVRGGHVGNLPDRRCLGDGELTVVLFVDWSKALLVGKLPMADVRKASDAGRLPAIDALRGVAVYAVVLSHFPFSTRTIDAAEGSTDLFPSWALSVSHYGQYGVHLFLVLSGFCIHMRASRRPDPRAPVDFFAFWRRRLYRLYPPYVVALLATLGGLFLLHGVVGHASGGLAAKFGYDDPSLFVVDLVLLFLLAQNLNGASGRVGNGPFWTLALEEQLYLLYFLLLHLRRKLGWRRTLFISLAITVTFRFFGTAFAPTSWLPVWNLVGPARWFEWSLGALAVEAHHGHVKLPAAARSFAVGTGALVLAVVAHQFPRSMGWHTLPNPVDDPLFGVAFFILLNATIARPWSGYFFRALTWLGGISYSVYLTHNPVMVVTKQLALRVGLPVFVAGALRLTVPIIVAYIFYRVVESRFLHASREPKARAA